MISVVCRRYGFCCPLGRGWIYCRMTEFVCDVSCVFYSVDRACVLCLAGPTTDSVYSMSVLSRSENIITNYNWALRDEL